MAKIKAFKAVRPNEKNAKQIISLPYDVMSTEEAKKIAKDNPLSFLHISRSEIDLPDIKDEHCQEVYNKAKENLHKFIDSNFMLVDNDESLYVYRQVMKDNVQTGLVGLVSVDDYNENIVKKHELTRIEKEEDRTNHFDTVDAQTEPIFLTYKDKNKIKIKNIINYYADCNEPLYNINLKDGIVHTLWKIIDKDIISEIVHLFKDEDLYIADGHHRTASAYNVCMKRRKENNTSGDENYNYFMGAIFPDSDLKIYDYNRVIKDLNGLSVDQLLKKIEKANFDIIEVKNPHKPSEKGEFGMYVEKKWYKLNAKKSIIPENPVDSLDVSILQNNILSPILGINDPRTDDRIDFVGGIRGLQGLEERIDSDMKIAFSTFPVNIEDLINVADSGMIMPPKSTWFEPKMGSGLFIHKLS